MSTPQDPAAPKSAADKGEGEKQVPVPVRPPAWRGPRGGPFGAGAPVEKAMNFTGSGKRLLGKLRPEAAKLVGVVLLGITSVVMTVLGPRLLGEGTNLIFEGAISKQLPAGTTKAQIVQGLRASGQDGQADLLSGMHLTPGHGIDFGALSTVLFWVLALYVFSSVFGWLQA